MARVLYNSPNRISQGFSSSHKAVDLRKSSVESENVVYAHSSGTVVDVVDGYDTMQGSTGMLSYGNYVFIDHGNGYKTRYAHLLKNSITVTVGQHLDENTKLGVMGESGNAYGRHLHFEVHQNGVRINPVPYLTSAFGGSTTQPQGAKYQVYDNVKKYWLPNVTIGSSDYAGNFGNAIGGVYLDTYRMRVHDMNKGYWLPWVQNRNDYAGNLGNSIDGIQIEGVAYRAHLKGGSWLAWVTKADNTNQGYAGIYGKAIDAIQIKSL